MPLQLLLHGFPDGAIRVGEGVHDIFGGFALEGFFLALKL